MLLVVLGLGGCKEDMYFSVCRIVEYATVNKTHLFETAPGLILKQMENDIESNKRSFND
jgi:hypothetical protein